MAIEPCPRSKRIEVYAACIILYAQGYDLGICDAINNVMCTYLDYSEKKELFPEFERMEPLGSDRTDLWFHPHPSCKAGQEIRIKALIKCLSLAWQSPV